MKRDYDWLNVELSVLYGIFYEQGIALGGAYVSLRYAAKARGDSEALEFWRSKSRALRQERDAVDASDREQIIATMQRWHDTMELVHQ